MLQLPSCGLAVPTRGTPVRLASGDLLREGSPCFGGEYFGIFVADRVPGVVYLCYEPWAFGLAEFAPLTSHDMVIGAFCPQMLLVLESRLELS